MDNIIDEMDLISLHVPKCAGTSLRDALINAYGENQIYFDNADRLLDPQSPINLDRQNFLRQFKSTRDSILTGKRIIHGHFCMQKYHHIKAPRVTILREPVDRLISHYLFWQHLPPSGHTLHDRFLAEKPSLVEFARLPGLRHFYSNLLFRDLDMEIFALVGSMERMTETIAGLEKITGKKFHFEKRNDNRCAHCSQQKAEISEMKNILAELRNILAGDIAFYERHVTL